MREKVSRLEKDIEIQNAALKAQQEGCEDELDKLRDDQKQFVTYNHLDAVVEPIKDTLNVVQKDVKEILRAVSTKGFSKN